MHFVQNLILKKGGTEVRLNFYMSMLLSQQQLSLEVCRMSDVFIRASVFNSQIQEAVVAFAYCCLLKDVQGHCWNSEPNQPNHFIAIL